MLWRVLGGATREVYAGGRRCIGQTGVTNSARKGRSVNPQTSFLVDANLGLCVDESPWREFLPTVGIVAEPTVDLDELDARIARHEPDIVFTPVPGFHRLLTGGDRSYRGLAIVTSKFTGRTNLPSVLVVRADDPAGSIDDLQGSTYGYINKSCTSCYFAAAILLHRRGKSLEEFFDIRPTAPWQGQIDAVKSGTVRATMVPEDVWQGTPENSADTKIIDRYDDPTGPVIIVRDGLDEGILKPFLDALLEWKPGPDALYGPFKPYRNDDVADFFRDLDRLPVGD